MACTSLRAVALAIAIGCFNAPTAHAVVIDTFDTQLLLANSDFTRFLSLTESPGSGQSIPFDTQGSGQFVGSSNRIGDDLRIATNASQLTGGRLLTQFTLFSMNNSDMFPQGVTFPDGTPANNLAWLVGGPLADRDGIIDDFQPFGIATPINILFYRLQSG